MSALSRKRAQAQASLLAWRISRPHVVAPLGADRAVEPLHRRSVPRQPFCSATAVVILPVPSYVRPYRLLGADRHVAVTLTEPLGGRVLLNPAGRPIQVPLDAA